MDKILKELTEQRRLLRLEYEEEKRAFTQATRKVGLRRLVRRGDAWTDLKVGRSYYNSLNQRILEVTRDENIDDDHHFEYGRPVAFLISQSDEDQHPRLAFTGTVNFVDANRMAVAIPESAQVTRLEDAGSVAVMLSFDETTYRAMFEALDRTISAKGRLGELRDLLYSRRLAREFSFPEMTFPYLNESQQEGVNKVLRAKDVAIVHGPPGTGKTTTLVEAINETLRRESQVLVCAQSNMAVDWICEKLIDRGIHVLRIGNPSRVNDKMLSFTYERRFEDHPDYPALWSIRKALRELRSTRKRSEQWHQKIDRLKSRATELEYRINNDLFNSAHVIASTLTGSAHRILSGMKFSTVFIDEAAQALEAASLIPLRRAERLILAGDHCQLPPTVKSYEAMRQGLGRSLMERLVENHPEAVTLLTTQYRMNRAIMNFSSEWFYGGRMEAAPEVSHRGLLDFDTPIEWIDTSEPECRDVPVECRDVPEECRDMPVARQQRLTDYNATVDNDGDDNAADDPVSDDPNLPESFHEETQGDGRINRAEAALTIQVLQNYITKIGKERFLSERIDVGVISPYRAQMLHLRQLIKREPFFKPFRQAITVNTVDGFQGQERDVILVSMVRSNKEGQIGFLRDLRRMNVAMTRARMKLILIGSTATLCRHRFYRLLREYVCNIGG